MSFVCLTTVSDVGACSGMILYKRYIHVPSYAVFHFQRFWKPVLVHEFHSLNHLLHPGGIKQGQGREVRCTFVAPLCSLSHLFLLIFGGAVDIFLQQSHSFTKLLVSKLQRLILLHVLSKVHLSITKAFLQGNTNQGSTQRVGVLGFSHSSPSFPLGISYNHKL